MYERFCGRFIRRVIAGAPQSGRASNFGNIPPLPDSDDDDDIASATGRRRRRER